VRVGPSRAAASSARAHASSCPRASRIGLDRRTGERRDPQPHRLLGDPAALAAVWDLPDDHGLARQAGVLPAVGRATPVAPHLWVALARTATRLVLAPGRGLPPAAPAHDPVSTARCKPACSCVVLMSPGRWPPGSPRTSFRVPNDVTEATERAGRTPCPHSAERGPDDCARCAAGEEQPDPPAPPSQDSTSPRPVPLVTCGTWQAC
jgi:hypothetical protein